jgi:hypothetical protein
MPPPPRQQTKPTVLVYPPGQFPVVIEELSTDPIILAAQLSDHQPFSNGPQASLQAVVDMYKYHHLTPAQHATALRVLADTDTLQDRGVATDPAGRTGIAITVDSDAGATRDIAIFDPDTGDLLSYERIALLSPARSTLRPPAVITYVIYLAHSRTDQPE